MPPHVSTQLANWLPFALELRVTGGARRRAGTLLEAGCGLRTAEATRALVTLGEGGEDGQPGVVPARREAGPTMPASGLCLEHVEYDAAWPGCSEQSA